MTDTTSGLQPNTPRFWTCDGKGGRYELIARAKGAGKSKLISDFLVYRDTTSGEVFYREPEDFSDRMVPHPDQTAPATRPIDVVSPLVMRRLVELVYQYTGEPDSEKRERHYKALIDALGMNREGFNADLNMLLSTAQPLRGFDVAGNPRLAPTVIEQQMVIVLNTLKAWRDSAPGTPFPAEIDDLTSALLMSYEVRRK